MVHVVLVVDLGGGQVRDFVELVVVLLGHPDEEVLEPHELEVDVEPQVLESVQVVVDVRTHHERDDLVLRVLVVVVVDGFW